MRQVFLSVALFGCIGFFFFSVYASHFLRQRGTSTTPAPSTESLQSRGYLIDTPGCQIPAWDPFDHTVARFFRPNHDYQCIGKPSFITVLPKAIVQLNSKVLWKHYGVTPDEMHCTYRGIRRDGGSGRDWTDSRYKYGPAKVLLFGSPIAEDFVVIKCTRQKREFFQQYLPLVPLRGSKKVEAASCQNKTRMNVLMVGIDSISYLNFERHFQKTKSFLRNTLKAVQLHGYTKVADNTFPNIVPLLTGHHIAYYWNETMRDMAFDRLDFVWKEFATCGYKTFFAEDAPSMATFNYLKRGFRKAPADCYMRPFWLAAQESIVWRKSRKHCLGARMEVDIMYDYLADFADTYNPTNPFFAFLFVARLTHDVLNYAGYADGPTYRLLHRLHNSGALRNTLLIVFSDHGIRFGSIRQTYIGKFEERMPMMFLAFPEEFFNKYPEAQKRLRVNARRLTTPFDVHATLQHIASFNIEQPHRTELGYSLIQEIPSNRTCPEASILPHWCTCQNRTSAPTSDPGVENASRVVTETVNHWLEPYQDRCAKLSVHSIKDAWVSVPNEAVLRFIRNHNDVINRYAEMGKRVPAAVDYMVTLVAKPSMAVLEATVRYHEMKMEYEVLDDVSRLDRYGSQGDCITDAGMRRFCFCVLPHEPATEAP
ncbi:uncharacterized protein LOC135396241 [Ornithodoros turicata]|uniref:uncharacterized protein LOC135396241 n=1 Tax=Ornithodoros turicata TaxID=34597 RepID=UPI003139B258